MSEFAYRSEVVELRKLMCNQFDLHTDTEGTINTNVATNTEDIEENSEGIIDVAEVADENSISIEDLAEIIDGLLAAIEDLEQRVTALEEAN